MAERPEPLSRKTVTVLFCDVAESTSLGESIDPETTRRVMLRYFDEMRPILERHGGTVEKFIGDAVLGVFGVPVLHEDDALRAVRAAEEMRNALERLNGELESRWGVRLQARIGINTGEVVVGDPTARQTIASGDTFNVAARLQQAAQPGDILLGRETYRLVSDRIRAGPLRTFSLKGKREGVPTWRLDEVRSSADRVFRRLDSPLVGRQQEQGVLHDVYRRALEDQTCELVTVFGAAGIGKTRLAQEFAARVFGATVAQGRCVPYGDGVTFWPIVEIVRELAGITGEDPPAEARRRLAQLVPDGDDASLVCERVGGVIGLGDGARSEEAFWALRRLFEAVARRRPLVLVIEDVHWAEPTLLDLIEYLVGWSRGAPLMVLCLARPELLESRTSWAGGRTTTHALALEPLGAEEVGALLTNLLGSAPLERGLERRIAAAADGNPLFVEELVRMLVDDGILSRVGDEWAVEGDLDLLAIPPSINALLTARIDQLDPEERTVLQCASVVGRQFWWSAVSELAPPAVRESVGTYLHSLVRKRLIAPDESTMFTSEDSFRFAHILIRDAAYGALPKAQRADLHERFADWLDRKGAYEEMRGHHLDRAFTARSELGPIDDATRALGERAATILASAGRRAFVRGDMLAAVALLTRATELPAQDDAARLGLVTDLAKALTEGGELARAHVLLTKAIDEAERLGEERIRAHAMIARAYVSFRTDATGALEETRNVALAALTTFSQLEDERGLAHASRLISLTHSWVSHWRAMGDCLQDALEHAERADDPRERLMILTWLAVSLYYGPIPVEEALRRTEDIAELVRPDRVCEAKALALLGGLFAMQQRFSEADEMIASSLGVLEELDVPLPLGHNRRIAADVHLHAGRTDAAEHELQLAHSTLRRVGDRAGVVSVALELADVLCAQGRYAEAEEYVAPAREVLDRSDVMTRVTGLAVEARLLGQAGSLDDAHTFARRAVALAEATDALTTRARAWLALAEVLRRRGEQGESRAAGAKAVERFEAKADRAAAAQARALLSSALPARA